MIIEARAKGRPNVRSIRSVSLRSARRWPGMDGLQLLGEIRQRFPDLPVMMVTAYGDDERRLRATEYAQRIFL